MTLITVLLFCSFILVIMASETNNAFNKFAKIYDIKYHNIEEKKKAFKNFQNNYKKVANFNQGRIDDFKNTGVHSYHLNRYADQDVSEILERYGVTMLPYYFVKDEHDYLQKYEENIKKLPKKKYEFV